MRPKSQKVSLRVLRPLLNLQLESHCQLNVGHKQSLAKFVKAKFYSYSRIILHKIDSLITNIDIFTQESAMKNIFTYVWVALKQPNFWCYRNAIVHSPLNLSRKGSVSWDKIEGMSHLNLIGIYSRRKKHGEKFNLSSQKFRQVEFSSV